MEFAPVSIFSFGINHGFYPQKPADNTLQSIFDVRFLPDPWEKELKEYGTEKKIQDFLLQHSFVKDWLESLKQQIALSLSGKPLTLYFMCAGGQQRSVAIATMIYEWLLSLGVNATLEHKDLGKWKP